MKKTYKSNKKNKPKIDNDAIRGRRLTNLESMSLLIQEPIIINQKVLDEILEPYIKCR
jgi:hypothetical protein